MTELANLDDEQVLIERAKRGDADAFRRLVGRYHARLYGWALALTGDSDDADDVEQAALVRVYRGLAGYQGTGRFSTWLYPIVKSAAIDLHRSRKGRAAMLERMSLQVEPAPSPPGPSETLDRERLTELALGYYRELPERQREVFALADLQGYSPSEIAEMMGVEAVTVRTHLLRARRTIRGRLLEHYPELVEGLRT